MKRLSIVLFLASLLIMSCSEEESKTKEKKESKEEKQEPSEEAISEEPEVKATIYESFPEAIGDCPESSSFTEFSAKSGLLEKYADFDFVNNTKTCKALIKESELEEGNYKMFLYFSNTDAYSVQRMASGKIGDLDSDKDYIVIVSIESKGLILPGEYKASDDAEMKLNKLFIFGKGKDDESFIRSGIGLDEGSVLKLHSISENSVCGEFSLVGWDADNNCKGNFNCSWEQ